MLQVCVRRGSLRTNLYLVIKAGGHAGLTWLESFLQGIKLLKEVPRINTVKTASQITCSSLGAVKIPNR